MFSLVAMATGLSTHVTLNPVGDGMIYYLISYIIFVCQKVAASRTAVKATQLTKVKDGTNYVRLTVT